MAQPVIYQQPYGRPYYPGHGGGHDSCCLALYVSTYDWNRGQHEL